MDFPCVCLRNLRDMENMLPVAWLWGIICISGSGGVHNGLQL